jgi:glycosyltransferase involved in cell wall biosynthesis
MSAPLVSVVIPTHNRSHFLAQAIDSVRAQTFTDYEIIVVSNGESDENRRASQTVAHDCIYLSLADSNLSVARNAGIERARGEWIAFLDDDDLWLPNKLERQIAEIEQVNPDMIAGDYVEFFPDGSEIIRRPRLIEGWTYVEALNYLYWWAAPSATMVRKRVFEQIGGFDPLLRYGEDGDMWRRISWCHSIHQMDEVLVRVRRGHSSLTSHQRIMRFYNLVHYFKMRRDTPAHLRRTLPSATFFIGSHVSAILVPQWLLSRLQPRTRLIALRAWLRPRSRINALRYRLRIRTRVRSLAQAFLMQKRKGQ